VGSNKDRVGSMSRWISLLTGLSLALAACGGQNVASNATATTAAIRWSETVAPQGIDVPGAQWLKIEGAGGKSNNLQLAAVLRPAAAGTFPLVVWLHGSDGTLLTDATAASQLSAGGFVVLVGCWKFTPESADLIRGIPVPRIPCLQNFASTDDAIQALIEVGQQLPGVKKGAIGTFGVSAGGPLALQLTATRTDIGAVVVDSSLRGPAKVSAPVLILGGTADLTISAESQQTYEQALRDSGTTVEAHYYEGGMHGVAEMGDFQVDAIKRMIDFYGRYLK